MKNLENIKKNKDRSESRLRREPLWKDGTGNALELMKDMNSCVEFFLKELHEEIENNSYNYIVGDDTSARAITLLFGKTVQEIQKRRGKVSPKIIFLNAGEILGEAYGEKYSKIINSEKYNKALIVTEIVSAGASVNNITDFLHQNRIDSVDVISQTGIDPDRIAPPDEKWTGGTKLHGINKAFSLKPTNTFSMAFKVPKINGLNSNLRAVKGEAGEVARVVRDYISVSSEELADEYLKNNP